MKARVITTKGWRWRECLWKRRGLAVTASNRGHGWTITFLPSGHSVYGGIDDPLKALRAANLMADAMDWRTIPLPFTAKHGDALGPFVSAVLQMFEVIRP